MNNQLIHKWTSLITIFSFLLFFTISCEESKNYDEIDQLIIEQYIADNNLNATATSSGLYYVIDVEGTGAQPTQSDNVTVGYKGYLNDGTVFDQTQGLNSISFSLQSVIDGWKEGIPKFKEGGSGILLIPSRLGYGNQQVGSIPRNSVLIFDVRLVAVK